MLRMKLKVSLYINMDSKVIDNIYLFQRNKNVLLNVNTFINKHTIHQ